MSQVELSKRYARAILQLGNQKDQAKQYSVQISQIAEALSKDAEVLQFFSNTTVPQEVKKKSLETVFQSGKYSDDVKAFLFLLIDRSRMSAISSIAKAAENILDTEAGVTRGIIRSSAAVSEKSKNEYEKKIGSSMGKKIFLESIIDESVMGGVRVEVGGWTFDDSLETHLDQISDKLMKAKN